MRERSITRLAFGKAAGFFYAVVASVVANLVFAYVLPHGISLARHDPAPPPAALVAPTGSASKQVAAVAPLPRPSPPAPAPVAARAASPPLAPAQMAGARPGPGSGGLY
jgi:hypothetical protein